MKITKQELIKMHACAPGIERFIRQTHHTDEPVDVAALVGGRNTFLDLIWLAGKRIGQDRVFRFACDCTLLSIDLIKSDLRNFNEIKDWLTNPVDDNAAMVRDYARQSAEYLYSDYIIEAADIASLAARIASIVARGAPVGNDRANKIELAAYSAAMQASVVVDKEIVHELLRQMFNEVE